MEKESLSASMPKLIIAVVLIVCIGAVLGMMSYSLTVPKSEVVVDNVIEEEEIEEDINDEEIIQDETADWETYKSSETNFSIKVPANFKAFLDINPLDTPSYDELISNFFIKDADNIHDAMLVRVESWVNHFNADTMQEEPPSLKWIDFDISIRDRGNLNFKKEEFVIDNNPAVKVSSEVEVSLAGDMEKRITVYSIKENQMYIISAYIDAKQQDFYLPIFNQILSTFKFIEKDETADWKTYRNEEYGFEVKYPENISFSKYEPPEKRDYKIYNRTIFKIENHSRIEIVVSILDKNKFNLLFNNTEYKKIEIDNHKAFRRNGVGKYYFDIIEILGDKYLYEIKYSDWRVEYDQESLNLIGHIKEEDRDLIAKNELIFDQILSTFKFIEK